MQLHLDKESLDVYKALASETRLEILNRLAEKPSTSSELALAMGISKPIISRHIQMLENAHLIKLSKSHASSDNRKKVYTLQVDHAEIVFPKKIYLPYQKKTVEIKLGYFSDFSVHPTCGLLSKDKIIGKFDEPRVFVLNERVDASLLWLTDGYVEYKTPNLLEKNHVPEMLEISMEIASEFPISNNAWQSDITFHVNGVPIGTWLCPGNYADVRGKLTPLWWNEHFSQYGLLKHIRVNRDNTSIDGDMLSETKLEDLHLTDSPFITLRIGTNKNAVHRGGITIFGEFFGNHPQNILMSLYYSQG